jgi:hypothetical protein
MPGETTIKYDEANEAKANFDKVYLQRDPRAYYRVLLGLDYVIPDLAKGVFRNVVSALEGLRGRRIKVLDIGSSYGINAALLRYPLDIDRLAQRYLDLDAAMIGSDEVLRLDRSYFSAWPGRDVEIVGLDVSEPAIDYACKVGLLDAGMAEDLECGPPSARLKEMLRGVDLIISTGCVGYVSERTFSRLLAAIDGPKPWIASFVLRMFPFGAIERVLAEQAAMVTEKLEGVTFIQRRFHSEQECREALAMLDQQGIKIQGKEAEGFYHAELFLSRPRRELDCVSLDEIAAVTSGRNRRYGSRWQLFGDSDVRFTR